MKEQIIQFIELNPGTCASTISNDFKLPFLEVIKLLNKLAYKEKKIKRVFETKQGEFKAYYYPLPTKKEA